MLTKFHNSNYDNTQKVKKWRNSKTQIVTTRKKSKWDKTQVVTKLKLWQSSNCDKTQFVTKLKLWQNSNCETKIKNSNVTTQTVTKPENSYYDKTPNLKLWQNLKSNLDKLEIWQISIKKTKKTLNWSFSKNILTPWQPMRCSLGSVLRFSRCLQVTCRVSERI